MGTPNKVPLILGNPFVPRRGFGRQLAGYHPRSAVLRFRVLGCRVLGFRVKDLGFRVLGVLVSRLRARRCGVSLGFKVIGFIRAAESGV